MPGHQMGGVGLPIEPVVRARQADGFGLQSAMLEKWINFRWILLDRKHLEVRPGEPYCWDVRV